MTATNTELWRIPDADLAVIASRLIEDDEVIAARGEQRRRIAVLTDTPIPDDEQANAAESARTAIESANAAVEDIRRELEDEQEELDYARSRVSRTQDRLAEAIGELRKLERQLARK